MDLIFPQNGLTVPGQKRQDVICPFPGKKVTNIVGFTALANLSVTGSTPIIPNTNINKAYLIDILGATLKASGNVSHVIVVGDLLTVVSGLVLYPNYASLGGSPLGATALVNGFNYKGVICTNLRLIATLTGGAIADFNLQGYELTLANIT